MELPKTGEFAHIGKSVAIKGELSGSEDLYIDGQVEGSIELQGSSLTVGPNGQVRANVNAKVVIIHGKLEGDIATQRIAIEDGAYFKGKIEIHKETAKQAPNSAISSTASARSSPMPKTAVTETK